MEDGAITLEVVVMSGKSCCAVCNVVGVLVGIGALNWGLVGIFNVDLVAMLLGMGMAAKAVYAVIGIAGLLKLVSFVKPCPCCNKASAGGSCSSK